MPAGHPSAVAWGIEFPTNPAVLRLHVRASLTDETIVTCPPATAPSPLDGLLEIEAVRSLDLHPTRVRLNLRPDADRAEAAGHVAGVLSGAWGPAAPVPADPAPRAFEAATDGPRTVAESPSMAVGHALLTAVFGVDGVIEAVAGDGLVLVRLGRWYDWSDREAEVARAVQTARGTPGSTSSPV